MSVSAADPVVQPWITQGRSVIGPAMPTVKVEDFDGPANAETKYEGGVILLKWRRGYPAQLYLPSPNAADLAQAAIDVEYTACHDIAHGIAAWLRSLGIDVERELYALRGFTTDPVQDRATADAEGVEVGWPRHPWERVAETMRAAIGGRWIRPERTLNEGKFINPMDARAWLLSLVARATAAPIPTPTPTVPSKTSAKVLWHLSHHSSLRADGWSGAPDEARWVREDLTPRVQAHCAPYGIELVLVDGDLSDHHEFRDDYLAFCAPHYEANLHGMGGWFWGRARLSLTGDRDDVLGAIFERRYTELIEASNGPAPHPEWTNPNVTDYYAFRLTTANTPGILVEHGVGWRLPVDYDFTWLRLHVDEIAEVWARTLLEFAGGALPAEEDDLDEKQVLEIIEKNYGLKNTVAAVKTTLEGQAAAITKLATNETLDDAEVAQLQARIDKLKTI